MGRRIVRAPLRVAAAVAVLVGATVGSRGAVAGPNDKQACLASYVDAQALQKDARLHAAREAMVTCARDVCPERLRNDCVAWIEQVDAAMPTVVVEARGPSGEDRADVRVLLDGARFLASLDGRAAPLDPGVHAFRYELAGALPIEEKVVIREGEKNRKLVARFAPVAASQPPPPQPEPQPQPSGPTVPGAPPTLARPVPALAYALAAIGLAGGVEFAVMGSLGEFGNNGLQGLNECKGHCDPGRVQDVEHKFLAADIGLGVGIASLGAAALVFLLRPAVPTPTAPRPSSLRVESIRVGVSSAGARSLSLGGRF